jgi:Concanavalin A-like lectin/glucanases superfamily
MLVAMALAGGLASEAHAQASGYAGAVLATPGLQSYWRLGEPSGTTAADATGRAPGSYVGAPALGARGALPLDPDTAVRFDGIDDEVEAPGGAAARTLEGWFDWEGGVAVMRDSTAAGGWILAYDNAGRVAYRAGGTTFTTTRATADLRTGWHQVALTVSGGATAFYLDGALVHSGTGAGATPAALPWHVMRNGTTTQYARGRADEVAVYDTALSAATIRDHFDRGRNLAGLLGAYSPSLRYESQEGYFADSAAEMTDNFVTGSRQNYLVNGSGTRLAAANPADPLANLSLSFLGDPTYADGRAAASTDYLDAANSTYQQDAQRMRAAGYGDRVYGRAVTSGGRTFLTYWLFSYYNPQNVFGYGVHEGDWEYVQVALDEDGAPATATYAQHDGAERCAWSSVQRTAAGAPLVYVALASHASYFAPGVNGRGLLPDDYHRGGGYAVRPALESVSQSTPFMAWRGKWGASGSSPVAPRRQGKWGDPGGLEAGADACTVGPTQSAATQSALSAEVATPQITATRQGANAVIRYTLDGADPDTTVLLSVSAAGAPDDISIEQARVRGRSGMAAVRIPPHATGPLVVSASAFSPARGARSRVVQAPLP